jgi:hypothetical protein
MHPPTVQSEELEHSNEIVIPAKNRHPGVHNLPSEAVRMLLFEEHAPVPQTITMGPFRGSTRLVPITRNAGSRRKGRVTMRFSPRLPPQFEEPTHESSEFRDRPAGAVGRGLGHRYHR